MATSGFGATRDAKRHGYNSSRIRTITQNMATPCYKRIRYILFVFFQQNKNELVLMTAVRRNLNTFDTRDCLHTFIAAKRSIKINCWKSEGGTCPNDP